MTYTIHSVVMPLMRIMTILVIPALILGEINLINKIMYKLTQKTHDILDMIGYNLDRVFNDTSNLWWTIGKSRKFIALWLTKQEWVERWFLTIHPLYKLCEWNAIIHESWLQKHLTLEQVKDFYEKSTWSTRVEEWFYARDVKKYLQLSWL